MIDDEEGVFLTSLTLFYASTTSHRLLFAHTLPREVQMALNAVRPALQRADAFPGKEG